jgi:hypothetical protein
MTISLSRPQHTERFFPLPASLWDMHGAATDFLRLADAPMTIKQRAQGRELPLPLRLGRMLFHLRVALTEEAAGRRKAADSYWTAMSRDYAVAETVPDAWPAVGGLAGGEVAARYRDEVLVDVGCSLINGLLDAETPPVERVMEHMRRLLSWATEPTCRQRLAETGAEALVAMGDRNGCWPAVSRSLRELENMFEDSLIISNFSAKACFHDAMKALRASGTDHAAAAATLKPPIDRLSRQRDKDPTNLGLYDMLSVLHHAHAVQLASDLRLPLALAEAYRAVVLGGDDKQSRPLFSDLIDAMNDLQKRCEALRKELASTSNARLNERGEKMMAAGRVGFSVVNELIDSTEVKGLVQGRLLASRRRLWSAAGLPPRKEAFDDATAALDTLLVAVPRGGSGDDWPQRLEAAAAGQPLLAGIDWAAVARALDGDLPAKPETAAVLRLPVKAAPATGDHEPLAYAYYAPESLSVRLLSIAAAAAIFLAAGLWGWEAWSKANRDRAYVAMKAAETNDDNQAALANAAAFLRAPALAGKDRRIAEVKQVYARTIVRWFVGLPEAPDGPQREVLDTYRMLSAKYDGRED